MNLIITYNLEQKQNVIYPSLPQLVTTRKISKVIFGDCRQCHSVPFDHITVCKSVPTTTQETVVCVCQTVSVTVPEFVQVQQ